MIYNFLAKSIFVSIQKEIDLSIYFTIMATRGSENQNSQIGISINLAEKISRKGMQWTNQSVYDNVRIHIEILCVGWDAKKPLPIVCWLLFKSFCTEAKSDILLKANIMAVSVRKNKSMAIHIITNLPLIILSVTPNRKLCICETQF